MNTLTQQMQLDRPDKCAYCEEPREKHTTDHSCPRFYWHAIHNLDEVAEDVERVAKVEEDEKVVRKIIFELYHAMQLLGAKSDLLSIIGSWKDTLSQKEVLAQLELWNNATAVDCRFPGLTLNTAQKKEPEITYKTLTELKEEIATRSFLSVCCNCKTEYPDDLLGIYTADGTPRAVCGICALELVNKSHNMELSFSDEEKERLRQAAIAWRFEHGIGNLNDS